MGLDLRGSTPAAGPTTESCGVEVIRDAADLDRLRDEWDQLFVASPTAAPPLRREWVQTWWHVYGPEYGDRGRGLRILTVRRDGRLIGTLPLYLGRRGRSFLGPRRLGFVSTGAAEFEETCTEYLNLLHAPSEEAACLQALAPWIRQPGKLGWDELHLTDLPADSPVLGLASGFGGPWIRVRPAQPDVCHLFSMAGGFDGYLQRLSHENRRQARKMLREVETEGMEFEVAADAGRLHLFFDQMIELHRQRWNAAGKPGSFAPRHAEFHRAVSELLLGRGEAIIARLSLADRPLAVAFGYRTRDKVHCYQQGVAPGVGRVRSPGTAAWLLLMRHQAERGVTVFDHLRGMTQFKERFATDQTPLAGLCVTRIGPRTVSASAVDWVRRAARRAGKLLPRAGKATNPVAPVTPPHEAGQRPAERLRAKKEDLTSAVLATQDEDRK
ncbi:MAG TPA: GNAT family N-acetyltransferase [Gemmataceae bacterium]|jgi:CelD/BcsL family acetyltransferase involved in cellulose biosynthesis|nr:GNAT family N-acetyltransferase [Gemmataceae bacterium]